MITNKIIQNALWQAWYHGELDDLASHHGKIDANDHPVLVHTARKLAERIRDELPSYTDHDPQT